jgi:hypothetical protein
MVLNAQVIDWKNFDGKTMNDVIFNKITNYIISTTFHDDNGMDVKGTAPKRYDSLNSKESVSIEVFSKIKRKDVNSYQDIANECFKEWENTMSFMLWSKSVEVTCKYKKITQTVTVWVTSRR